MVVSPESDAVATDPVNRRLWFFCDSPIEAKEPCRYMLFGSELAEGSAMLFEVVISWRNRRLAFKRDQS